MGPPTTAVAGDDDDVLPGVGGASVLGTRPGATTGLLPLSIAVDPPPGSAGNAGSGMLATGFVEVLWWCPCFEWCREDLPGFGATDGDEPPLEPWWRVGVGLDPDGAVEEDVGLADELLVTVSVPEPDTM